MANTIAKKRGRPPKNKNPEGIGQEKESVETVSTAKASNAGEKKAKNFSLLDDPVVKNFNFSKPWKGDKGLSAKDHSLFAWRGIFNQADQDQLFFPL